jgi:hypothetical protein
MRRMSAVMRNATVLVIAALIGFAPLAPATHAQDLGDDAAAPGVVQAQALDPPLEEERWWGAAGAILCGAEVRLIRVVPAIGLNPYVLAAGLGGCLLAAMDLISSH